MTSFDLAAIIQELDDTIVGSRLDNIYQVSPLTLLLVFHPRQRLIVEAGRRIHLTQYEVEKPRSPSLFCRVLRKLLNRGVVRGVRMEDFERVVSIEIASKETSYRLVCEVFGKGNIILTDGEDAILHALSYRRMRDRNIIRGETLKPPPSRGYSPLEITRQEFEGLREQRGEVVSALSKLLVVGGLYAEELLLRAGVDKRRAASSLTGEETDRIYREVINLVSDLTRREPHIVVDGDGGWVDVLQFPLKTYSDFKAESYPTYNEAADEYFTKLAREDENGAYKDIIQDIEEQKRILNQQEESLKSLDRDAEENRRIGDAIYLHALELQSLFQQVKEARVKDIGWDKVMSDLNERRGGGETPATLIDSIDPERGALTIRIDDLCFKLDLRRSVFENASQFYEKAKESKAKTERLRKAIIETRNKIEDLERSQLRLKGEEASPVRVRKRVWFEKFHWAESSEGLLMIGGRDASTNELLIKRHMDADDLVFHADVSGAPFVVLKTGGRAPSEQTMFEAAQLAASYSRGWREGWASLDVYWVRPEQVSKQAPSGEYLSKGMFMVRGQKNYIRNVPLRVSIGVVERGGDLLVIGGPVSAIIAHARYKVDIVPGRLASGSVAKMTRDSLATNATKELREKILKLKIEEVQRFIPAGKSEIAIR